MYKPFKTLQSLEFRSFVAGFRAESAALWFLCLYILMEYIRPYAMYSFDILPWGEITILCSVASVFITGNKASGIGIMDRMFIAFSILVILSGIFAWDPGESLKYWTTYTSWILMYFCVVSILTTPNRIFLFTLFFILINFKLSQHGARFFAMRGFSFSRWGLAGAPGWFHNSGEFSLQMGVMFSMSMSILLAFREYIKKSIRWWILMVLFPGTAALSIIGSSSRGGQIAFVAVVLVILMSGGHFFKKVLIITMLAYVGMYLLPAKQVARFHTAGDDQTSELRLIHWKNAIDTIGKNPWGIGYRNWVSYYGKNYNPPVVQPIHNTVLEAFAELGYPGGILFLLMLIASFVMNAKTIREMKRIDGVEGKSVAAIALGINLGLLDTFIAALFMSVLYYPMFWLAFALTSALRHISQNNVKDTQEIVRTK